MKSDLYSKWGNYIPQDLRKEFEIDWLEVEQQIKELKAALKIGLEAIQELHTFQDGWADDEETIKQALK